MLLNAVVSYLTKHFVKFKYFMVPYSCNNVVYNDSAILIYIEVSVENTNMLLALSYFRGQKSQRQADAGTG